MQLCKPKAYIATVKMFLNRFAGFKT